MTITKELLEEVQRRRALLIERIGRVEAETDVLTPQARAGQLDLDRWAEASTEAVEIVEALDLEIAGLDRLIDEENAA